jgi:hypothetical protein
MRVSGRNRLLKRYAVGALDGLQRRTVRVSLKLPRTLVDGARLRVCVDSRAKVRERSERNNCRAVGRIRGPARSSVPGDPIGFTADTVFTLDSPESNYWIYVPGSYDATHATPIGLLVWLHGCGGQSAGDIYTVSPGGAQSYLSIAVGGREGACWDVNADSAKVLAAVADVKTHFNVAPRRVVVGGYSSGGDLAYRTAFYNARRFAGVLAENTSPFRDTGSTQSASIGAAAWKLNIVHLAHTGDDVYPIAGVRAETDALKAAGFPITLIERPGAHYDAGTDPDLRTLLLPHMDDGWQSP